LYYEDFTSRLPEIQRAYLDKYLSDKIAEGALTPDRVEKIRRELWSRYTTLTQGPTPTPLSKRYMIKADYAGNMDSVRYDDLMDAVKIDLIALFSYSNVIDADISSQEDDAKSYVKYANTYIDSIERELLEYQALLGDVEGYNAAHVQNFNTVTGSRLIGTSISAGYLGLMYKNLTNYNTSIDISSIGVTRYPTESHLSEGGIYYAAPPENDIETDYNTRGGTRSMLLGGTTGPGYWVEVMLVDNTADHKAEAYINSSYYNGLSVVLTIYFTGTVPINMINLDPISKYTMYVRSLRYLPPGSSTWSTVQYTDSEGNSLNMVGEGYGGMSFRFNRVSARAIEIHLNVVDCDQVRFLVDPNLQISSKLWEEILDGEYTRMAKQSTYKNIISASAKEEDNRIYDKAVIATSKGSDSVLKDVIGIGNVAYRDTHYNDLVESVAGDIQVSKVWSEYILGLYSLTPGDATYIPTGTYYSHSDGGYDTKAGTIRNVLLESEHSIPACTTVEYYLVTDGGIDIPVLPNGTTTYREPVISEVDGSANLSVALTFLPIGNVDLMYWDPVTNTKITHKTAAPTGKSVSYTTVTTGRSYVVEYTISTSIDQYTVSMKDCVSGVAWYHDEVTPVGYKVILPTTPYIDGGYYDYSGKEWLNYDTITNEKVGLAGFYSDSTVLTQDIDDGLWQIIPSVAGTPELASVQCLYTDRNTYVISGYVDRAQITNYGPWYRVRFNGTGRERNEYSYVWDVSGAVIPGMGIYASGLVLDDTKLHYAGDPDNASIFGAASQLNSAQEAYVTNVIYNPIEIFVDGVKAVDYTDYKEDSQSQMDSYQVCNEYRYYMDNGAVYMNMNFDEVYTRRITVRMRYLTSYLNMKIVLKTNTTEDSFFTPLVDYYTVKFLSS
jgi:hypothetical protein